MPAAVLSACQLCSPSSASEEYKDFLESTITYRPDLHFMYFTDTRKGLKVMQVHSIFNGVQSGSPSASPTNLPCYTG